MESQQQHQQPQMYSARVKVVLFPHVRITKDADLSIFLNIDASSYTIYMRLVYFYH